MEFTALGAVFLPAALAVALLARRWIGAVIAFSVVLQGGSVLDFTLSAEAMGPQKLPLEGRFGVSPYPVAVAIAAMACILPVWRERARPLIVSLRRRDVQWLLAYAALAALGAFVLPRVFAGVQTYSLVAPYGFGLHTTPLVAHVSQMAQVSNLGVHLAALAVLLHLRAQPGWRPGHLLAGVAAGAVLVGLLGLWERLALLGAVDSHTAFWMSNPGYNQAHGAHLGSVLRVSAPFSEPSYASTYLAALICGLAAVAAFGRRTRIALAGAAAASLVLLNTLGSTGIAAAALGAATLLMLLSLRVPLGAAAPAALDVRARNAWLAALVALVACAAALWSPMLSERTHELLQEGVLEKLFGQESLSTITRARSNLHAIGLVAQTYGLGVGLGGNRASSFLASLLSNVGVAGCILFLGVLVMLVRRYARARLDDVQLFAFFALLGATWAVWIGIPDLNLPLYWSFLFLALTFCPGPQEVAQAPRRDG